MGVNSFLVEDASDLDLSWFNPDLRVGISAGASTPEVLVQEVLKRLDQLGIGKIVEMEAEPETVTFRLPVGLTKKVAGKSGSSGDVVINGVGK
jgi:4-hydroxy-3-methylbut-2-enyl diphosphate reductase